MKMLPLLACAALSVLTACSPEPEPEPAPVPAPEVTAEDISAFSDREIGCLARTAYHEARGEGRRGMAAVIHVVLNRTEAPAYPDDPCAVVEQGKGGACQFSWMCDGKPDEPKNLVVYKTALDIAEEAAAGDLADPTNGAVMFHAKRVTPYWVANAEQTAEIGSHLFYRLDE